MTQAEISLKVESETKLLVKLLLRYRVSEEELVKMSKIPLNVVNNRLNNEQEIVKIFNRVQNRIKSIEPIDKPYGEYIFELVTNERQENLNRRKQKETKQNEHFEVDSKPKNVNPLNIDLNRVTKNEEHQYRFLALSALTFHLNLTSLAFITGKCENEVYQDLYNYCGEYYSSINYLFNGCDSDQNEAIKNFVMYYRTLIDAKSRGDKEQVKELFGKINDREAIEFSKRYHMSQPLSDKDLAILLKFQLKYGHSIKKMTQIFDVSYHQYLENMQNYLMDKSELRSRYEALCDMHLQAYITHEGYKK
jgi:hypothetical protein